MARRVDGDMELFLLEKGYSLKNRVCTLVSTIKPKMFLHFDKALTEMERLSNEPVTIRINCHGGSTYDALAIVGRMQASPLDIITEGYGYVASAATLILAAGDQRTMSSIGWFMHHEDSMGVQGKLSEIKSSLKQAMREEQAWADAMASLTKKPSAFWLKTGVGTDVFFTPEELLEMGVVDFIK